MSKNLLHAIDYFSIGMVINSLILLIAFFILRLTINVPVALGIGFITSFILALRVYFWKDVKLEETIEI